MTDLNTDTATEGRRRKRAGQRAAKGVCSVWYGLAREQAKLWLGAMVGERVTGEEITAAVKEALGDPERDDGSPGSPNIFGSLSSHLLREGLLRETNEMVAMKLAKSNSRRTRVYVVESPKAPT